MKNVLVIAALASSIAAAASAEPSSEALLACSRLQDPGERVRCYDAQVAGLKAAPAAVPATPPAVVSPPTATAPATHAGASPASPLPPKAPPAAAGFGSDTLPLRARAPQPEQDRVLSSSITDLHQVAHQTYLISLANGQVWHQEGSPLPQLFFHVGDDVRIEKGAMGSYRMSTHSAGDKNWVRVTRVQ